MIESKIVPDFTCHTSKARTPKSGYWAMVASSLYSGLSISGCTHSPLYAGFSMRFTLHSPLYSGLGTLGGSHSPSSASSQSSGTVASGSAISFGISSHLAASKRKGCAGGLAALRGIGPEGQWDWAREPPTLARLPPAARDVNSWCAPRASCPPGRRSSSRPPSRTAWRPPGPVRRGA